MDFREILNALLYLARTGYGWRLLPKDFPPWKTVYWWFRYLLRRLPFQMIYNVALMLSRELAGREASLSTGVVDSQSGKARAAQKRGYDAGKTINGRKWHIAVDTDGRPMMMMNRTTANISDFAGAQKIFEAMRKRRQWMRHLFADSAYDRKKLLGKAAFLHFTIEVVRRTDTEPGFKVVPRRWVVERTFGWMTRWQRLVRNYEARIDVSGGMIQLAMASPLPQRVCHR